MKTPCRLASSLFFVITASCAFEAPPPDPGGDTATVFAFVDVNVIPMDTDRVIEGQTVLVMSALPEHVELRQRIDRGELLGPRLVLARMVDGPDRAWPPPISTWVSTPEEARQAVLDADRVGYDRIKVYSFIYTNLYQPIPQDQRAALRDGYYEFQRPLTGALNPAGARLMTGTDSLIPSNVPGFSIHDELAELVDVGLSPFEALRSSTTEPFAFLGEVDRAGTIEVGKQADLVLLQGNPLTDIAETRRISGVMIQGRWLGREEIEQGLERLAVSYQAGTH